MLRWKCVKRLLYKRFVKNINKNHLPPHSSFESTLSLIEVVGGGVLLLLVEAGVGVWLRACPRLRRLGGFWTRFPSILDTDSTQTHNHHDPYISDQPYPFQNKWMWKKKYFPKKSDTKFKSLLKHLNEFKEMICYDERKNESI